MVLPSDLKVEQIASEYFSSIHTFSQSSNDYNIIIKFDLHLLKYM